MKVIGITGGVGSGKSRVLSFIEEMDLGGGTLICQADHVAWKLQAVGEVCYQKIVVHFGEGILNEDRTISRRALGRIVFGDEKELAALNQIMHPAVRQEIENRIQTARQNGVRLFVLEAALLIEEHYDEICDELWYIYTDVQIRRERLKMSRGYTEEKMDAMMASQLPEEVFREKCSRVIDNSGSFDLTKERLTAAVIELERRGK